VDSSADCRKPEKSELVWLRGWRLFPHVDGFQQSLSVGQIDVVWQLSTRQAVDSDPHLVLRQHSGVPVRYPRVVAVLATQYREAFKATDPQGLENSYALILSSHKSVQPFTS
jgi:hypothetical protein